MELGTRAADAVRALLDEAGRTGPDAGHEADSAKTAGTGGATGTAETRGIAGIGTTAPRALRGGLLNAALSAEGLDPATRTAHTDPDALFADPAWSLALVLSPWKLDTARLLTHRAASAEETGVVDTIVRTDRVMVGLNTNTWAAQAAMGTVLGGQDPSRVVVLGSGGSARSVAAAVRRQWPGAELLGSARNDARLREWTSAFGAVPVAPADLADRFAKEAPDLVCNTTTWGETPESEKSGFAFPLSALFAPGGGYFDLNNRVSGLQTAALEAGMSVMSGTFMQRVTNRCRAKLLGEIGS